MAGKEGEWWEVRYRKEKYNELANITTFFVTNLPRGISNSMLWKAFQQYGRIKDAYVARKRDTRGNYFGFIRYEEVASMKHKNVTFE
ncbi:hypothetical protein R6Q57_003199 [Mikania cordata]